LQPDPEMMDWAFSPGTIFYVPVPTAQALQPEAVGMAPGACPQGPLEFTFASNKQHNTGQTGPAQPTTQCPQSPPATSSSGGNACGPENEMTWRRGIYHPPSCGTGSLSM